MKGIALRNDVSQISLIRFDFQVKHLHFHLLVLMPSILNVDLKTKIFGKHTIKVIFTLRYTILIYQIFR